MGFVFFRAKRKLNTTRLSVTIHFGKKHKEVYLKYGFMKYCTKLPNLTFYNNNHKGKSVIGPLKVFMKYSFGTFNLKRLYYVYS